MQQYVMDFWYISMKQTLRQPPGNGFYIIMSKVPNTQASNYTFLKQGPPH